MLEVDTAIPVLVTGANGYIASWIVKYLLEKGVTVHATVRDPANAEKVRHLRDLGRELSGEIKLFRADLLEDGSFEEAMKGVGIVFHTASPFKLRSNNPRQDFIEPAESGTRNVLNQASNTSTVTRVVLTSSTAAIGLAEDVSNPDHIFTEDSWNNSATVQDNPYPLSKVLAERAAMDLARNATWDLVVVNPGLVLGCSLSNSTTSGSFDMIRALGNGKFRDGLVGPANMSLSLVDVRNVAEAHLAAGYLKDISGRFMVFAESGSLLSIAEMLREKFGNYPLPPSGITFGGNIWKGDNSRSKIVLGIEYRPLKPGLEEMFEQLINHGKIILQE